MCHFVSFCVPDSLFALSADSASEDSRHNMANHGLIEGPNLCLHVSLSLSSNPDIGGKIPIDSSSPTNCKWSRGRVTFYKVAANFPSLWVLRSVQGDTELGRHSIRCPYRRQRFTTAECLSSGTKCWGWEGQ